MWVRGLVSPNFSEVRLPCSARGCLLPAILLTPAGTCVHPRDPEGHGKFRLGLAGTRRLESMRTPSTRRFIIKSPLFHSIPSTTAHLHNTSITMALVPFKFNLGGLTIGTPEFREEVVKQCRRACESSLP